MASLIRFGAFEVDPEAGELRKHGVKIKLADQPFLILLRLLDRPGEVVTRDELQRKLWAADTFVDFERGLNKAMNRLRDALNDSAAEPRFVETVPKRGYRFIGSVEAPPETEATIEAPPPTEALRDGRRWKYLAAGAGLLLVIACLALIYSRRPANNEQLLRSSLLPPPNTLFLPYNFALSPDGTHLAFVAVGSGKNLLWIRALSAVDAYALDDTDGARFPFWAPDNRHVGFFAGRKLKIEYVRRVLAAYRSTPGTTGTVHRPDRVLAVQLRQRGVPLTAIENALVLAAARRLMRPTDSTPLGIIRSLAYFLPVIEEVLTLNVHPDYFLYLRHKIEHLTQAQ
jgi:DNA-binding winged helix-turn-helix (wHTH) protein